MEPFGPPRPRASSHVWFRRGLGLAFVLVLVTALVVALTVPEGSESGKPLSPNPPGIAALAETDPGRVTAGMMVRLDDVHVAVSLPGRATAFDERVLVVNLSSYQVERTLNTDPGPFSLAVHPADDGLLLVGHLWSDGIETWRWRDGVRLAEMDAPHYVTGLAASPDGSRLYAVSLETASLHVLDLSLEERERDLGAGGRIRQDVPAGRELARAPVSPGARCVAVSEDRFVATCGAYAGRLDLFDDAAAPGDIGKTRRTLALGAPALSLAFHGGDLYVGTSQLAGPLPGNNSTAVELGWEVAESGILRLFGDLPGGSVATDHWYADTTNAAVPLDRRVVAGAIPAHLATDGDTLWAAYYGTDQVQALAIDDGALRVPASGDRGPNGRLSHVPADQALARGRLSDTVHRVYETGAGPIGVARMGDLLVTLDGLSATLTVTDLADCADATAPVAGCTRFAIPLDDAPRFPSGLVEQGRAAFASALWSGDQDRACASCHFGMDRDGLLHRLSWSMPGAANASLRTEDTRSLLDLESGAPYLSDGSLIRLRDYPGIAWLLQPPGTGVNRSYGDPASLVHPDDLAALGLGPDATLRTLGDALAAALVYESGLPPNPHAAASRTEREAAERGAEIFRSAGARCASCHLQPYTSGPPSKPVYPGTGPDRDVPTLRGAWRLDGSLWAGNEGPANLREVLLPPRHSCLATGERGLALATGAAGGGTTPEPGTVGMTGHGGAGSLTCDGVEALVRYVRTF